MMSPQVCTEEEKKKRKTKVRVDRDTLCMDTRSIAGVYQRFFTPLLHQQLHTHYFRTLSMIIINRSEIVATERRQMLLFEITRRNEAATAVRERDLQKTWRKRIRQDYMRLFRSELGKKIFGRSQRKVLAEVFKGWVRYWSWHRGHKEAFELKYAVIKHGVDLRRLHPKILGMKLPGRVPRDDDVPSLEGYDKRVDAKPVLEIEPEPEPEPEVDPHADDPLDSPETRRKKENMREYLAEQAADEEKRKAKEAADEALYGPRFTEIMDGNRRIAKDREADRLKGGLSHEVGGQPVECVPCSPRQVPDLVAQKAQSWKPAPENEGEKRLKFRKTFNERLRERSIICKTCGQTYTEAHNSAFACGYHPGSYRVACPASCPAHKDVSKITPACMGHRRKRWSCCDSVFEGKAVGGATGCKYRYHLPPSEEPRYGDVAAKMLEDVVRTEKQLDEQIEESRSNSTVRHAMKLNRDQLALAAERQAKERSIVAKFKELKCDKHMDEHVLVSALQEYETSKAEEEKERMAKAAGHTYRTVWKSTSASGAPDNFSLSHFSATTRPCWLNRVVRDPHRHAIEQASRRWRGGRRDDSARTRRQILISTQVQKQEPHRLRQEGGGPGIAGPDGPRLLEERAGFRARRGVYRVIVFTGVAAADAHPDAVHDDLWFDAVDVGAADGLERALDLPQARGRVAPVHGPVVLTVVCVFINLKGPAVAVANAAARRRRARRVRPALRPFVRKSIYRNTFTRLQAGGACLLVCRALTA